MKLPIHKLTREHARDEWSFNRHSCHGNQRQARRMWAERYAMIRGWTARRNPFDV